MKSFFTIRVALAVSLGGFLFGFDASVISGVIEFVKPQFGLSDIQIGWVVSSPSFAAMFAMLVAGVISDYIGRKKVLVYAGLLYSVSALASALAPGYEILVIARMIGGLAFGAALVLAPVYIAEMAPAEQRGKLVSIQQFNIVLGFSISYFSNYYLLNTMEGGNTFLNEANTWRWMLGIELVPAIGYFFLMLFVPRSPRWLLMKNREAEAEKVMVKIYGSERASIEIRELGKNIRHSQNQKSKLSVLFSAKLLVVLTVALTLGIIQQVTGINAVLFYAPTIFEQSGVGTNAAFAQAVLVGIVQVIFTVLAMFTIDKIGRKPLILAGLLGVLFSMGITAYGFSKATYRLTAEAIETLSADIDEHKLKPFEEMLFTSDVHFKNELREALGTKDYDKHEGAIIKEAIHMNARMILVGILLFIASFALSLGPVMWVVLSEIFPNHIRGGAIAFVGLINSLASFLIQLLFPWGLSNMGNAATYAIFGVFALIGFIILLKIMPETKGKSLEQIERELIRNE